MALHTQKCFHSVSSFSKIIIIIIIPTWSYLTTTPHFGRPLYTKGRRLNGQTLGLEMRQNLCVLTASAKSLLFRGILVNTISKQKSVIHLPGYGVRPQLIISVSKMPKDQTSDLMVKEPQLMASGAVHLMGNLAPVYCGQLKTSQLTLLWRHQLAPNDTAEEFPAGHTSS